MGAVVKMGDVSVVTFVGDGHEIVLIGVRDAQIVFNSNSVRSAHIPRVADRRRAGRE